MAPEHHFKFWNNDEVKPSLAWQIFRQGRFYEQMKLAEKAERQSKSSNIPRWQTNGRQ